MILFILGGAAFLSSCMAFTGIPKALAAWVAAMNPNPYMLIAVLAGIYIILGTALDGVSMMVLAIALITVFPGMVTWLPEVVIRK